MSVFVHAQGNKTVHEEGGGVRKWQNSVHIIVECPPRITINSCSLCSHDYAHVVMDTRSGKWLLRSHAWAHYPSVCETTVS